MHLYTVFGIALAICSFSHVSGRSVIEDKFNQGCDKTMGDLLKNFCRKMECQNGNWVEVARCEDYIKESCKPDELVYENGDLEFPACCPKCIDAVKETKLRIVRAASDDKKKEDANGTTGSGKKHKKDMDAESKTTILPEKSTTASPNLDNSTETSTLPPTTTVTTTKSTAAPEKTTTVTQSDASVSTTTVTSSTGSDNSSNKTEAPSVPTTDKPAENLNGTTTNVPENNSNGTTTNVPENNSNGTTMEPEGTTKKSGTVGLSATISIILVTMSSILLK